MADRTQENLARIRACDADWNENDHPRADNGQFTSGSGGGGVKISKFKGQSGKVKAEREAAYREQVETENKINALNRQLESCPEYRRANRNASLGTGQTRINGVEERARLKKEADKELDPLREQWRNAYAKQRSLSNKVGAKANTLKNVSAQLAGVNAGIEQADKTFAARMDRTRKAGAAKHKDLEQREDAVRKKYDGDWRYGHMYGKLKNKPGYEGLAERVKNKAKSREAQKRDELAGLEKEYHQIQNEYDPIVGERQRAANKQYGKTMSQLYPQKQALEAEQKKFDAAKSTLAKVRPKIASMRQLAKAAASKKDALVKKINADPKLKAEVMSLKGKPKAPAAKPTLQKLQQAMHSGSMMGDRAELHIDGQDYVKIGKDKWEHHPSNSRVLGGTFSSKQMMDIINKAKKVDLNE